MEKEKKKEKALKKQGKHLLPIIKITTEELEGKVRDFVYKVPDGYGGYIERKLEEDEVYLVMLEIFDILHPK